MGCHFLLQDIFPNPGIKPQSPALQADSLPSEPAGKPWCVHRHKYTFSCTHRATGKARDRGLSQLRHSISCEMSPPAPQLSPSSGLSQTSSPPACMQTPQSTQLILEAELLSLPLLEDNIPSSPRLVFNFQPKALSAPSASPYSI